MRNLTLTALAIFMSFIAFAQSPCTHSVIWKSWYHQGYQSDKYLQVQVNSGATGGQKIDYTVDFGDGSTLQNTYTNYSTYYFDHLYQSYGTYNVQVIVKVVDSVTNTVVCIDSSKTVVNIRSKPCDFDYSYTINGQAKQGVFTVISVPTGSNMTYTWSINGTVIGTGNPFTYTFSQWANYNVTLTTNNGACKDTITKMIPVQQNRIRGNVYFDSTYLDTTAVLKVWLIEFDSTTNILSAVDSQLISVYNSQFKLYEALYTFMNKPSGKYRVKAAFVQGQGIGIGNMPTYHTSSLWWLTATVINHAGGNTNGTDINMIKGIVIPGPGFIGGNIFQGANKGTANGIPEMNVFLLDANGDPVAHAVTDANGDYSFNNIALGTYKVHPEDMNYTTTEASVILSNSSTSKTSVNFVRSHSQKTILPVAGSVADVNTHAGFAVYPNPATDVITISWTKQSDKTATIAITDISGKKMLDTQAAMNNDTRINVSALQPGIYFMNIHSDSGTSTQKLVIQ